MSAKDCIVSDDESMKIWAPPFSSGGLLLIMERGVPFEIFSARRATLITCNKKPGVAWRLLYFLR